MSGAGLPPGVWNVKPPHHLAHGLAIFATLGALVAVAPYPEKGVQLVSSDHYLVSEAGAEMLRAGGNATDAVVASALAAGVVQPAGSGLGGGGFAVVRAGGETAVWDFREVAPAAAQRDLFRTADGSVDSAASRVGARAVAVPGESRGLARLLREHGTLTAAEVVSPALRFATRGFRMGPHLAGSLERSKQPEVLALFDVGAGSAPLLSRTVKRPRLAATLRRWAATGGEDLHTGRGARMVADALQEGGGILVAEDLAAYEPKVREPLVGAFHGRAVHTMPPPSSGGVVLLQMLAVLEGYDLAALGHNSSDYIHLVSEVMKHAYADRAHHLGDPDFVEVPVDHLLSEERVAEIRSKVWPGRTFPPEAYGPLFAPPRDAGTQHISAIDASGGAAALTTTINTAFGSGVVVEDAGLILNNEMDDFAAAPGVPNAYGLVGGEANAIDARKRPLSSMSPTLVLGEDDSVEIAVGASGGTFIISATLQVLLDLLVFDMDPQEAVAAPRFHHQWQPDLLFLEPGIPRDVQDALRARGHQLQVRDGFSSVQLVAVDEDGLRVGGADPRKSGWPAGAW